MPRTIDIGFRDFHERLTPNETETEAAKTHRESIENCLTANYGLLRFFRTGSFGNGTSISGFSDVDYFASIPTDKLKKYSNSSLREIRDTLDARFPRTGVRVSCPTISVPFGTSAEETHEIAPADFVRKTSEGYYVYDIPDCNNGWMKSSPDALNAYVRQINVKHGYKVKPLIRFIKAWKYFQSVPISSIYLELRVAKYASEEQSIIYDIDVHRVFKLLWDIQLADMQDPQGISGYISATYTNAQKEEALSKLGTALTRATKAREAASADKISDAFYWWNLLYANKFPSYYY